MQAVTWDLRSHTCTLRHRCKPTLPYYALNQINLAVIRSKTNMKRYLSSALAVVARSSRITIVYNIHWQYRNEMLDTTFKSVTGTDHSLLYFNNNKQHCIVNTARGSERTTCRLVIANDARKRLEGEGSGARGAVPSTQSWNAARPFSRAYFFDRYRREGTPLLESLASLLIIRDATSSSHHFFTLLQITHAINNPITK